MIPLILALALQAPPPTPAPGPLAVVLTPRAFEPALAEWLAHRRRELRVELVVLEALLASAPGADDPEKVKRHLYGAWKERGARYALLVGDGDVFPLRYMALDRLTPAASDVAFYPSDLYYGDVAKRDGSFEDWNGAREGASARYFGEVRGEKHKQPPINHDNIDYLPELGVGRWPASTPEEVRRIAARTLAYERALAVRAPAPSRALLVVTGGWVDARGALDAMGSSLGASWRLERLYYADGARVEGSLAPDEATLMGRLATLPELVVHAGHALESGWDGCLSMSAPARLPGIVPLMISAGCSSATFAPLAPYERYRDEAGVLHAGTNNGQVFEGPPPPPGAYQQGELDRTSIGEALLLAAEGGAVAYFGCDTGSQPCGLTLVAGLTAAVGDPGRARLGDCWTAAVEHYWRAERLAELTPTESWYPPSVFFQGMKFVLFGDPCMALPRGTAPAGGREGG